MRYFALLTCAFALTALTMNVVVFGQFTSAHKGSCLVIRLSDSKKSMSKSRTFKNSSLQKVQYFLDAAKIPLEISYVKTDQQYELPWNFLEKFFVPKQVQPLPNEPEPIIPAPEFKAEQEASPVLVRAKATYSFDTYSLIEPLAEEVHEHEYSIIDQAQTYNEFETRLESTN
jgi:hypothetical protein